MKIRVLAFLVCVMMIPRAADAIEYFGGPIIPMLCPLGSVIPGLTGVCKCANDALYIPVGPPRPGAFVYNLTSRVYQSGPPIRPGQWVLGQASVNYYCVISLSPTVVLPGKYIDFLGSSF